MPFCFKRKESMEKAVRRICCERIEAALKCLKQPDHLEGVHAVRKEIKKLRAILRLVRGEMEKRNYRKLTETLRKIAGRLAAMRDAHVKLNAFNDLMKRQKHPTRNFQEIKNALRQNCLNGEQKFLKGNSVKQMERILQKLKCQAKGLEISADGWDAICSGLKKSYRRGREAFEAVRAKPSPENFHEWRKRVKDLWLQSKLLCLSSPKQLRSATDQLESSGNSLGDDHDLFMLAQFVAGKNFDCDETPALEKLICQRQKQLRALALRTGGKFYSETSKQFCRRIENYWKRWREEK